MPAVVNIIVLDVTSPLSPRKYTALLLDTCRAIVGVKLFHRPRKRRRSLTPSFLAPSKGEKSNQDHEENAAHCTTNGSATA